VDRWATFDCYGTLIDWNSGVSRELERVFGSADRLSRYHQIEPAVQAEDPSASYRSVMTEVMRRLGAPRGEEKGLAESLPEWGPFPEVPAALREIRDRGWRPAILSNTDRDFIDASIANIGVPFDVVIVASEIGSYKPMVGHWRAFERETGTLPTVHVGASHFHDVVPALGLGIPTVWVNRLGEEGVPPPTREIAELAPLPGVLAELSPA